MIVISQLGRGRLFFEATRKLVIRNSSLSLVYSTARVDRYDGGVPWYPTMNMWREGCTHSMQGWPMSFTNFHKSNKASLSGRERSKTSGPVDFGVAKMAKVGIWSSKFSPLAQTLYNRFKFNRAQIENDSLVIHEFHDPKYLKYLEGVGN